MNVVCCRVDEVVCHYRDLLTDFRKKKQTAVDESVSSYEKAICVLN